VARRRHHHDEVGSLPEDGLDARGEIAADAWQAGGGVGVVALGADAHHPIPAAQTEDDLGRRRREADDAGGRAGWGGRRRWAEGPWPQAQRTSRTSNTAHSLGSSRRPAGTSRVRQASTTWPRGRIGLRCPTPPRPSALFEGRHSSCYALPTTILGGGEKARGT